MMTNSKLKREKLEQRRKSLALFELVAFVGIVVLIYVGYGMIEFYFSPLKEEIIATVGYLYMVYGIVSFLGCLGLGFLLWKAMKEKKNIEKILF